MKIVYIHYHLKTGGVTSVIRQQLQAAENEEILVLTGEPLTEDFPADTVVIPGLGYNRTLTKDSDSETVAAAVTDAILEKWPGGCDLIHVHNPTIEKNRWLISILRLLQNNGHKLLLQIHDFAEDGRPNVYPHDAYPPDCHYCVINSRDYDILLKTGLTHEGLHLLPNTVKPLKNKPPSSSESTCILYPVRAVRRKNIGEAILLSLFFPDNLPLCITQPANSPADIHSYADWKTFARHHKMNVQFDVGVHSDFNAWVRDSKFMLTTSIMEGFGFSFLEPWTTGKVLWGRKLPDLCCDFEANGIGLNHLYKKLNVPIDWIDKSEFFDCWTACVALRSKQLGCPIPQTEIEAAFNRITADEVIDFGILDEYFQKQVISKLLLDRNNQRWLIQLNPTLSSPGVVPDSPALIHQNSRKVMEVYHPDNYRCQLLAIYDRVRHKAVKHRIDKQKLVSAFFNLDTFSLLKWRDYDNPK